jgi:hypothetical protein
MVLDFKTLIISTFYSMAYFEFQMFIITLPPIRVLKRTNNLSLREFFKRLFLKIKGQVKQIDPNCM